MGLFYFISSLILLVCVLLVLIVLIQNSKGGGLAPNFSGAGSVMGVRETTNIVEKATWTFAITLGVLCIIASAVLPTRHEEAGGSRIQEQLNRTLNSSESTSVPIIPEAGDAQNLEDVLEEPTSPDAPVTPAE